VKGVVPKSRYKGYEGVATEIAKFYKTGELPVSSDETIELFGFMEAAHESGRRGGVPVQISEVVEKAQLAVANRTGHPQQEWTIRINGDGRLQTPVACRRFADTAGF